MSDIQDMTSSERLVADAVESGVLDNQERPVISEGDGVRAGYKIEITFGPDRSTFKEYPALISLWESGKHFHGGGDSLMYLCFDCENIDPRSSWKHLMVILDKKEESVKGCGGSVPAASMSGGFGFCPSCQKVVNAERLTNPLPFVGTTQELAGLVARIFRSLKTNADIYCKYHPTDFRYQAMETAKGLETARRLRGMFIYPLARILKDTAAGAALETRLCAFFNA